MRKNSKGETSSTQKSVGKTVKKKPRGKTTSELMHRQLTNKDAVITDEEFKNIDLETNTPPLENPQSQPTSNDTEKRKEDNKSDNAGQHEIITPWDVLGD